MYASPDCYRKYRKLYNEFNSFVEEKLPGYNDFIIPIVYITDAKKIYDGCNYLLGNIDVLLPALKENSSKIAYYEADKAKLLSIKEDVSNILNNIKNHSL